MLRGEFGKPDSYQAALTEKLPVPTNGATGHFFDAIAEVINEHPEVTKLLSGEITVADLR